MGVVFFMLQPFTCCLQLFMDRQQPAMHSLYNKLSDKITLNMVFLWKDMAIQ